MSDADVLDLPSGPLSLNRVRVMGILNTTPDSFYDGGRYAGSLDTALGRVEEMLAEGADIIDVGGEKAGPGEPVPVEEEIRRTAPLIRAIRQRYDVHVSVDTFKAPVAGAAVDAGADIINSIGGFRDEALRRVARQTEAGIVIMHIQGQPRVANPEPHYTDVVEEVREFLLRQAQLCEREGIAPDRIIVDPGPGFGKSTEHDLAVVRGLSRLTSLPYPVLLAASRKKFIGDVLGAAVEDRLDGSLAVAAWGVLRGVRIVRAHDVRATVRVCRMAEAVRHPDLVGTRQ